MKIRRVLPNGAVGAVGAVGEGVAAARAQGGFVWLELDHPTDADFADVVHTLGLHPLAVEDAVSARDRPKLDIYDDQQFFALVTLRRESTSSTVRVGRVMAFVGDAFVVTVRQEDGDTLERASRRLERTSDRRRTSFDVVHTLVDTVVDDLAMVSREVEGSILASADRLFSSGRADEARQLYDITRLLLAMAHAVRPLIEPLRHLGGGAIASIDVEERRRFQDVLDHALVLDREISDYSELVEHLRGSNDSRIGLQQNLDMRKIAAWAAVIAVPTAITGFFGMNVPYPGFAEPVGVIIAVTLQVVCAVSLVVVFRRRGWL